MSFRIVRNGTPAWDAHNMRTICTRIRTKQAEELDGILARHSITRYEAVRRFCVSVLRNEKTLTNLDWR